MTRHRQRILPGDAGQRLDRYLRKVLREVPLGALHKWVRQGRATVDGRRLAAFDRLVAGALLVLDLPDGAVPGQPRRRPVRSDLDLPVVLRDSHLLAVVKPAGVPVHGGTGIVGGDLDGWLQARIGPGLERRAVAFAPAAAHRLDRVTSGLVLCGLTPEGLRGLNAAFRDGLVAKEYLALVCGRPDVEEGIVDGPLVRVASRRRDRPKMVVDPAGQPAVTRWRVLAVHGRHSLLTVTPETGRLHQIRAHLLHLGHPIVGDLRYGGGRPQGEGIGLHCWRLGLAHPVGGERLEIEAPVPEAITGMFGAWIPVRRPPRIP